MFHLLQIPKKAKSAKRLLTSPNFFFFLIFSRVTHSNINIFNGGLYDSKEL